ncbi:DHX8 [Mytilus coruscus]|uniref:DHX8 n=1 Tax=Mytilus coruscus TaxID=42192 RepID=A0A6J8DPG9_MYTCO|nr:DHX8 [Mytilus coruscus]
MESQTSEFKSFIKSFHCKLEKLKNSSFNEQELLELETSFKSECDRFAAALPIYACRTEICTMIYKYQTSVILGETGSGKSTQVVQYLYQTGIYSEGIIICTQPRKVAAISLATRVAKEMSSNVGNLVGYQVGMQSKKSKDTKILYVTDHVLLNECLRDPHLSLFSCIIIDEAHERSIFTDLLLGMIKKCLPSRPDLRVVVTSATIDPDVFVRFFGECPVLSVSGRTFPVDVEWTLEKAIDVHLREDKGDILVFLTSPLEVEKSCKQFEDKLRGYRDFICLPLHGKLQANEQQRVFNPASHGKRKIVFATNSAETSITIPGIKYVVDSGRIKEMQFDPKKNISSLVVTLVTQSSANQRSGRAGRTAPGKCFRLYSENEYKKMNVCSTPEILRVNLGQAILKLMELGVDPISFDFVESPPRHQLTNAMETLVSIGAVSDGMLTDIGKWIAKLPFDPIFGAFIHDAIECDVGIEALILTACCGSGGSLFYRSGTLADKTNADKMKIRFSHQGGDVMTMLNAYREWHVQPENSKGKWCAQNYVNGKTIKAVRETATEVLSILRKELQIILEFKLSDPEKVDLILQKMIFKTFKHNICHFLGHERAGYHVIHKAHDVCLFPSSSLPSLGLKPEWLVIEQVLK